MNLDFTSRPSGPLGKERVAKKKKKKTTNAERLAGENRGNDLALCILHRNNGVWWRLGWKNRTGVQILIRDAGPGVKTNYRWHLPIIIHLRHRPLHEHRHFLVPGHSPAVGLVVNDQ